MVHLALHTLDTALPRWREEGQACRTEIFPGATHSLYICLNFEKWIDNGTELLENVETVWSEGRSA